MYCDKSRISSWNTAYTHSQATGNPHGTTFAQIASKPTTLSGYGITDAQPLDSDLTAIAGLSTQPFGRSLLTQADAATARATLGAGTSNLALGETSSTAYRGDRGATAYTHSQATGNPHGTTFAQIASIPAAIDAIDGLTPAADRIAYYTGANGAALTPLSAFGRSLIDDADAATARATIDVPGAERINRLVGTSAQANTWFRVAQIERTSIGSSSVTLLAVLGGGSAAYANEVEATINLYASTLSSALISAFQYCAHSSVSPDLQIGYAIEQSDGTKIKLGIYAKTSSSVGPNALRFTVLAATADVTTYENSSPITTQPAGYLAAVYTWMTVGTVRAASVQAPSVPTYSTATTISNDTPDMFILASGASLTLSSSGAPVGRTFRFNTPTTGTSTNIVVPSGVTLIYGNIANTNTTVVINNLRNIVLSCFSLTLWALSD